MMSIVPTARVWLFFFFKPAFHDILEFGLDVAQNCHAGQVAESTPFVGELLWLNHVNLSENQHKRTSIIKESSTHMQVGGVSGEKIDSLCSLYSVKAE